MSLPLGQHDDDFDAHTVFGMLHQLLDHFHSEMKLWPLTGIGENLLTHNDSDVYGAWVQVILADTESEKYDVHYVAVSQASANDVYTLQLGEGAAKTIKASVPITKDAVQSAVLSYPCMNALIDPTQDLWARVRCVGVGVRTLNARFSYHNY